MSGCYGYEWILWLWVDVMVMSGYYVMGLVNDVDQKYIE